MATPRAATHYGLPAPLRIAFIHPNLGIGGAERLVVDAAVGLQKRGHSVEIFTSYHEDGKGGRSFEETRDGTLKVHVLGASIFPSSILGRFTIVCAILRQLHLTISILLATYLYILATIPILGPLFALFYTPVDKPFASSASWSPLRQLPPFDVVIVDQLSTCVPFLRWLGGNRVVFYCHFPDLLLSPGRADAHTGGPVPRMSLGGQLRSMYRMPVDMIEAATTGEADKILVNSEFTAQVFAKTFLEMGRLPRVVYPAVDVTAYGGKVDVKKEDAWLVSKRPTLLSINRFEGKKDVALAIDAFSRVRGDHKDLRLIVAGGYDPLLPENVTTLSSLQAFATSLSLSHHTFSAAPLPSSPLISASPPTTPQDVLFLLNMSAAQKALLLSSSLPVVALLYTPSHEHLGIVPLEAMASAIPVLATVTGGPTETIVDGGLGDDAAGQKTTGLLREPSGEVWAQALGELLALPEARRKRMGEEGQNRVRERYSVEKLAEELERACRDAVGIREAIFQEAGTLKFVAFVGIFMTVFSTAAGALAFL